VVVRTHSIRTVVYIIRQNACFNVRIPGTPYPFRCLQSFGIKYGVPGIQGIQAPLPSLYETALPGNFHLIPSPERQKELERDYRGMAEMFIEPPPSFDAIMTQVEAVEQRINTSDRREGKT